MVAVAGLMVADLDLRFERAIAGDLPSALVEPDERDRAELRRRRGARRAARRPRDERGRARRRPRRGSDSRSSAGRPSSPAPSDGSTPPAAGRSAWPASRAGGAGRLLDLHLHQLHPHASLRRGLAPQVPAGRVHRGGRPHARVPVREGGLERGAGDRRRRAHLSGRPGQRLRHLDRLRQPVLAGQVPDRRPGQGAVRALRRGLLRGDRAGDPQPARRGRAGAPRRPWRRPAPRPRIPRSPPPSPISAPAAPSGSRTARSAPAARAFGAIAPSALPPDQLAYGGGWRISGESATAGHDASLALSFQARRVFCVMGSRDRPRTDAGAARRPADSRLARRARTSAAAERDRSPTQRLYRLVDLPRAGRHVLSLRFAPGVAGYAFTFG